MGDDPTVALDLWASRSVGLNPKSQTSPSPEATSVSVVPVPKARLSVEAAIKIYLTTRKAAEKDWRKHTRQCYTQALKHFRASCPKVYVREINGDDLKQLKVFLRSLKTSTGKEVAARTVWNHFNNVVGFLNTYRRKDLIPQSEWPTSEEKKVVCYDEGVTAKLLRFADTEEADVLEFFRGVGFRNGETTHTEWPDINLRNKEIHIYSKREQYDWQVKDSEERIIPISDRLAERLRACHLRHPGNGLVFGNSRGNPDKHLLRVIKRVALRTQLNCGKCVATFQRKQMSCKDAPVCCKFIIHTLRKTSATFQSRSGTDTKTIKDDLGHSSMASTEKYLPSQSRRSPQRRQQVNAADALVRLPTAHDNQSPRMVQ